MRFQLCRIVPVCLCYQRLSGKYITLLLVTGLVPRGCVVITDIFPMVEHPRRMSGVCTQTQEAHGQLDSVVTVVVVLEYVRKKPGMHTNLVHEKVALL